MRTKPNAMFLGGKFILMDLKMGREKSNDYFFSMLQSGT